MKKIDKRLQNLKKILLNMQSVLIAYSGGLDSTFLVKVASDVLGDKVLAVTAVSAAYPVKEVKAAKDLIKKLKVKHIVIKTKELSNRKFIANTKDRCYWCKQELFSELKSLAKKHKLKYVLDGANYEDTKDFRPGAKAASELGVRSPLKEVGLDKAGIRYLSRKLNLSTWDKASFACLASRFPYGMKINKKNLNKVDKAESFLRDLGFSQVRVRHHDQMARIELAKQEMPRILSEPLRKKIVSCFKKLGYVYVSFDLEGYRTGSMNEPLKKQNV